MTFEVLSKSGKARSAHWTLSGSSWSTPMALNYTRHGAIPHLVSKPDCNPLYISMEQFLTVQEPFEKYLGVSDSIFIADAFDVARLTDEPFLSHGKNSIGVFSQNHIKMTMEMYANAVRVSCPHVVVIPGDPQTLLYQKLGQGEKCIDLSKNQMRKRVERGLKWAKDLLGLFPQGCSSSPLFIGSLDGLDSPEDRKLFAKELVSQHGERLNGYLMHFPSSNPKLIECISSSIEPLPISHPRILIGISDLRHIVQAVRLGIDVIDNTMAYTLTEQGKALICSFGSKLDSTLIPSSIEFTSEYQVILDMNPTTPQKPKTRTSKTVFAESKDAQGPTKADFSHLRNQPRKMDPSLSTSIWKHDLTSLFSKCGCFACSRPHSRAYILHLLTVQDMLARVLLMHHNQFQLHQFMSQIKCSIDHGTFEADATSFLGE